MGNDTSAKANITYFSLINFKRHKIIYFSPKQNDTQKLFILANENEVRP